MNAEELDPNAVTHKTDYKDPITVERGNFSWSEEVKNMTLFPIFCFSI